MPLPEWINEGNFPAVQRIAKRHDIRCALRVAIVTGDETKVCNCNGKIGVYGQTKTTPRERTLADVRRDVEAK